MYKLFSAILLLLLSGSLQAQPYLDIVNIKYTTSPNLGFINRDNNDVVIRYFNVSTNLPVQFNKKKDAVIFSPYFENWSSQVVTGGWKNYYGLGLPVSLSKTISSKWNILLAGILRMNDSCISNKGRMQAGGAFIAAYKRSGKLTWKLGVYVNGEYFGVFVMPLVGLDWNITARDNLFGVLPGNLTYEHKLNRHFYYGANFRAITNSYAKTAGYWRVDENQLGVYLDTYFNKNLVLNIEAGHSLYRKMRTGIKHVSTYNADANDNFYFKLSFAYRVRFNK